MFKWEFLLSVEIAIISFSEIVTANTVAISRVWRQCSELYGNWQDMIGHSCQHGPIEWSE